MKSRARTLLTPLTALLVPVLLVGLGGCDDGRSQPDDVELEPGPATEGVPGAAGSITPHRWDTDPDQIVTRAQFDARWSEGGRPPFWPGAEEGLDLDDFAAGLHQAWDLDGSGAVDREELADALRRHGIFDRVDRDGSGVIEDRELADWWFDVWDADDDQRLQPAEREALDRAERGNG